MNAFKVTKTEVYRDHLLMAGVRHIPLAGSVWEIVIGNLIGDRKVIARVADDSYCVAVEKAHTFIDDLVQ